MTERVVPGRLWNVLTMFLTTVVFTVFVCLRHGFWIDEILCAVFFNLAFFVLFVLALESSRLRCEIRESATVSYKKIVCVFLLACVVGIAEDFMPAFTRPVILIPIVLSVYATTQIAAMVGLYFAAMLTLSANGSLYEMLCYTFLVAFGCILTEFMRQKKYRVWVGMIVFSVSVLMPELFDYFYNKDWNIQLLLWGAGNGLVLQVVLQILYQRPELERDNDTTAILEEMVEEDYPLAREIHQFSKSEYNHAVRVSNISYRLALRIGANEKLAAAAGFYYRLGKLEGEPVVENGVRLAENHFFPEEVVQILREYGGEQELPSTLESAIVHMVDAVVKKLEVLDKRTVSNDWNQDMVVYQTLNEMSSKGVYDKSGMSMNLFLKLREQLVKEEGLL